MAQLHGRARNVAELSDYPVAIFNDRADPHGIIVVVVVKWAVAPRLLFEKD